MSYTINVDIEVHDDGERAITTEEALYAARIHFGRIYDQRPTEQVDVTRGPDKIPVTVSTVLIKIAQGVDPAE